MTESLHTPVPPSAPLGFEQAGERERARGAFAETLHHDSTYRRALAASDIACALLALLFSVVLIGGHGLRWPALLSATAVVLVAKIAGLYDHDNLVLRRSTLDEVPWLFHIATLNALAVWLSEDALIYGRLTPGQVVLLWISFLAFVLAGRSAARAILRRRTTTERCMLVGGDELWDKLSKSLSAHSGVDLVSYFPLRCLDGGRHEPLGVQLGAARMRLSEALQRDNVHRVIIPMEDDLVDHNLDGILLLSSLGVKVTVIPRMPEVLGSAGEFEDLDGMPILGVRSLRLSRSSLLVKRSFDVCASLVALVIAAPVFLAVAVGVRLSSPGPIFFRQPRVGRDGHSFKIFKFRTMLDGAADRREELAHLNETNGLFKIAHDPRVTSFGRRLRSSSLDELPQLLNVLRGEMSLVGPRPLVPEEDRLVQGWARRRLDLTPGMTGHWQVLGSTRVPLEEMVKIDYLYIANWSLWADIKVLMRTLPHVLARRGV